MLDPNDWYTDGQSADDSWYSPYAVSQELTNAGIVGQEAAKRTAALILFDCIERRPSVNLFCGPSGSGKTEIWRTMHRLHGNIPIVVQDASSLTAEGWKGGNKISSILRSLPLADINGEFKPHGILIFDEFDKLLEPQCGSSGTDYSQLMQGQMLRLFEHERVFVGEDEDKRGKFIDCSQISIVLLGAFQRLLEDKSRQTGSIGFGADPKHECNYANTEITQEDLVEYGMRSELAGRIDRICCMSPLSVSDLVAITQQETRRFESLLNKKIDLDPNIPVLLARIAHKKPFGARWIRSELRRMIDDQFFMSPSKKAITLEYEPPDADDRRCARDT